MTFGCLNTFAKVSKPALALWREILAQVANSRLILHAEPGSHRQKVKEFFAERGISPARIEFVGKQSWEKYAQAYQQIDIALDPFPYGGGITTCDALYMGVPLVTLVGNTAVGRGGKSVLSNIGLEECIAETPEQYQQIALNLAGNLERLAHLRAVLRERMRCSPLMDAAAFARDIEGIYRSVWHTWCESDKN